MTTMTEAIENLRNYTYISLTTFRKNGEGIVTPVTIGEADGKLYVVTGFNTGKIKRLKNNPDVEFAPCDQRGNVLGAVVQGQARILSQEESKTMRSQIKFHAPAPVMFMFNRLRDWRAGGNAYIEITVN